MCGITGFWNFHRTQTVCDSLEYCRQMLKAIRHRGPDKQEIWHDNRQGIYLGHARLSILDLSPQGNQPMISRNGRFVIVFNGEIYNFHEIRNQLEKTARIPWRGHSDTEIILEGFEQWGIPKTLQELSGMFAIAIWDREENKLWLTRDRIGEKPLYYGLQNGTFFFASELKCFRNLPFATLSIDRNSLCLYLRHNCIPAPWSIFQNVKKLLPGTYLEISPSELISSTLPSPKYYWEPNHVLLEVKRHTFSGSFDNAVNDLEQLLLEVVRREMISDVPLGAFLSGGIDSSTIVALMQSISEKPIKTFTIGFFENQYNEAEHAKAVAHHLGTEHHERYISGTEALKVIPKIATIWDEPFGDSSQIPTYLVSEMAREHVTVCLSGDAGDEVFGGYNRYCWAQRMWSYFNTIPWHVRNAAGKAITKIRPSRLKTLLDTVQTVFPIPVINPSDKFFKFADLMQVRAPADLYFDLVSHWKNPSSLVLHSEEPQTLLSKPLDVDISYVEKMMYWDLLTYLPDDILVKVDRAGMSVSLESRIPFLDHSIVEFAWSLPIEYKVKNGLGKKILRSLLEKYVPKELVDRPKMGFGIPLDSWLRGPLREWAESLLSQNRLSDEGYFSPRIIRQYWQEHLSGAHNWQYHLWDILMFQDWLEKFHNTK